MSVIRIILASGLMALPTAAEQDVIDLQQIAQKIKDYRKSLFEQEGGLEFTSTLSAVKDPNEEFAFRDSLSIKTVILWPKLFISGTGQLRDQPEPGTRVSVYDFVKHQTKGYDNQGGVIYPGRHLFSGGYSLMFKYLHFAEGYQQYDLRVDVPDLCNVSIDPICAVAVVRLCIDDFYSVLIFETFRTLRFYTCNADEIRTVQFF